MFVRSHLQGDHPAVFILSSLLSYILFFSSPFHPFYTPKTFSPCSRHAEIYWEAAERSFFIRNISTEWYTPLTGGGVGTSPRGGSLYVRGEEVFPGDRGVPLKSQTVVQVGSVIFTFVLPSSKAAAHKQDIDVSTPYQAVLTLQLRPFFSYFHATSKS
jgi:hypothetical protein